MTIKRSSYDRPLSIHMRTFSINDAPLMSLAYIDRLEEQLSRITPVDHFSAGMNLKHDGIKRILKPSSVSGINSIHHDVLVDTAGLPLQNCGSNWCTNWRKLRHGTGLGWFRQITKSRGADLRAGHDS